MRKSYLTKSKRIRVKAAGILAVAALLAMGLTGCGDSKKETKNADKPAENTQDLEKEEFVFEEEDGKIYLTKYNGSDADVEVPEDYNNEPVYGIASNAFSDYAQIKTILIPYTVQDIAYDMLPEECNITMKVYKNSAGMEFADRKGLKAEYLGENPAQASSVRIYDPEGINSVELTLGEAPKEDWLSDVTFDTVDGKSVLTLGNCEIGSIDGYEYAALTIQLVQGSSARVTGNRGYDGIAVAGSLTITGSGRLEVTGSDLYAVREGEDARAGEGIAVLGNLVIADHVQLSVKAGQIKSRVKAGIFVQNGDLTVADSRVECYGGQDEMLHSAAIELYNYMDAETGNLNLENTKITTGGQLIQMLDEESQMPYGWTLGTGESVVYDEIAGYENASNYVVIEPES